MADILPKISIVTPSFNQGVYIEQTLRSVLDQGYPDLEYIVMDGGSTDGTIDILKRYEGRLRWFSEKDRGQSDALNKGMRLASGDVLAFINTDDLYERGALLRVGRYFAEHGDAMWVTGKCRNIRADGTEIRRVITRYKEFWLRIADARVLSVLNYVSQPATFWRRKVFTSIGPFDESLDYAMDYDYWLRMAGQFELQFIDAYLARYRIHPTSKAGSSASAQFDVAFDIAKRHARSAISLALHKAHDAVTVAMYRVLLALERERGSAG